MTVFRRGDAVWALGAGALVFAVFAPFAPLGVDIHHDGLVLKTAMDVAAGQMVFRETFSQYGMLAPLLQAAFLRLTAADLYHLKLLEVIAYAVTGGLLYLLARRFAPRGVAAVAVLAWLPFAYFYNGAWTMHAWSSGLALPFQVGAMVVVSSPTMRGRGFVAGALAGGAFLCRAPVGGLLLIALTAAAWAEGRMTQDSTKRWGRPFVGFALTVGAVLAWVVAQGALTDFWRQTVLWPARWGAENARGLQVLWGLAGNRSIGFFGFAALLLAFRLPGRTRWGMAAVVAVAVALHANFLRIPDGGWTLILPLTLLWTLASPLAFPFALRAAALAGLASWLQDIPIPCERHTFWANTPMVPLAIACVWVRAKLGCPGLRARSFVAAVVLLFTPAMVGKAQMGWGSLHAPLKEVRGIPSLAGMKASPEEIEAFEAVHGAWLAHGHGGPIYQRTHDALYATFSPDLRNASPIFVNWGARDDYRGELDAREDAFLREHRPMAVWDAPLSREAQAWARAHDYVPLLTTAVRPVTVLIPRQ